MEHESPKDAVLDQEKVDSDVARLKGLASTQRQEAIDGLLALEKQGRVAEDIVTTRKACTALLEVGPAAASARPAVLASCSASSILMSERCVVRKRTRHGCPHSKMFSMTDSPPKFGAARRTQPPAKPLGCPSRAPCPRCCTRRATGRRCRSMLCCCPSGAAS